MAGNTATIATKIRPALKGLIEDVAQERGETVSEWARKVIRRAAVEELQVKDGAGEEVS